MPENVSESERSRIESATGRSLAAERDTETALDRAGERVLRIGADRPIRISAGHRLLHHDGKCRRPHGHNYEISVDVTGELSEEGWVVDKGVVTDVIDEWDHRFLLETGDPLVDAFEAGGEGRSLVVLDAPPTAEVMAVLLEEKLLSRLPSTVSEVTVEVRETGELCASHR